MCLNFIFYFYTANVLFDHGTVSLEKDLLVKWEDSVLLKQKDALQKSINPTEAICSEQKQI